MLDRYKRIAFEHLCRKLIGGGTERLGIEHGTISSKQFLYNVQDSAFACAAFAVEDNKLLNLFAVAGYDGTNGPFDLLSFFFRI